MRLVLLGLVETKTICIAKDKRPFLIGVDKLFGYHLSVGY